MHLEHKDTILRHKGLGWIKISHASTNTSSLFDILQVHFSHADLIESSGEEGVVPDEEDQEQEGAAEKIQLGKQRKCVTLPPQNEFFLLNPFL